MAKGRSAHGRKRAHRRERRVLLAMGFQSHQRQIGIVRYAREAGWIVDSRLLAFHAAGQDYDYLRTSKYDGVLALLSKLAPWLPALVKSFDVPVVDMWADYPDEPYPRVLLDHAAIGRLGAEHLLMRGFRQLLFYSHLIEGKSARMRRDAFFATARAGGAEARELVWDHRLPAAPDVGPVRWLAGQLRELPMPLGVMGTNDHMACEVLEAAELAKLEVPAQVAVIGVDNDPLVTDLAPVPLSSIDSARELVGYEAAALLDRLMKRQKTPAAPILVPPGRIFTRRSTDVLAVRDRGVASAIQFIQNHFRDPITVDDVAAHSVVSRRHLQDSFLLDTGRTIGETITGQRLDHAKSLLANTRGKVHLIARQSGFGSGERMSKVFRRVVDMTPQQFRECYYQKPPQQREDNA